MLVFLFVTVLLQQASAQLYEGDRCTDSRTGSAGLCCLVHTCSSAQTDIRTGNGPTLCSFVGDTPVVCCRHGCGPSDTTEKVVQARKSELMCIEYDKVQETRAVTQKKKKRKRNNAQNENNRFRNSPGQRWRRQTSSALNTRQKLDKLSNFPQDGLVHTAAVGGEDASLDEFPHMAAIGWSLKIGGYAFNCGGSLISERFVLTAGHCLSNARDTTLASAEPSIVRLGDQNIVDPIKDGAEPLDVPINRRIKHPNYKPPSKYFDIALLRLQKVVPFSQHIKPACLWTRQDFGTHSMAVVTGWGTTVSGGRVGSAVLQKVKLDILETQTCQTLLQPSRNRNWQGFSEHQLCAGVLQGGKDACQGDSGGPLQVKSTSNIKKYHIIGVTSFGRECAKPNLPGVYTRVSAFIDWIEPIVWP